MVMVRGERIGAQYQNPPKVKGKMTWIVPDPETMLDENGMLKKR